MTTGDGSRFATKASGSTDAAASILRPVRPPAESGAIAKACHSWSVFRGSSKLLGSDAQATPLHSKASAPADFQPGFGKAREYERLAAVRRPKGRTALSCRVNTGPVMGNRG